MKKTWFPMPRIYRIGSTKLGLPDEHFQYNSGREIIVLMRYDKTVILKDFSGGLEYHQDFDDATAAWDAIQNIKAHLENDGFRQYRKGGGQ